MSRKTFRIAVRKYEPLEAVVPIFWEKYKEKSGSRLELEAVPMDLNPLYEAIFTEKGLHQGGWDVAHVNTDWLAGAKEDGALLDISPYIETDPPEGYPDGWPPALLRLQTFGKQIYGLPFHDGPECFIYRKDLFNDAEEITDPSRATVYTLDFARAKDLRELAKVLSGKEVVVIGMSELRMVTQKARPGGFGNGQQPPTPTWSLQRTVLVTGLKSAGNK